MHHSLASLFFGHVRPLVTLKSDFRADPASLFPRKAVTIPELYLPSPVRKRRSLMKVEKNKVVVFDYTLTDEDNEVLDTSDGDEPLAYLHGNGHIVPGLERAMEGRASGDSFSVSVPPEEGYGVRDESKVGEAPRSAFEKIGDLQPGMQFQAKGPHGVETVTVISVSDENVLLDANHPLAGETLNFAITVREIREATADELAHGHAHGPGGAHH
jgi:FKBP-type peptidyl-prolyl cis-trans isomerase SlyD